MSADPPEGGPPEGFAQREVRAPADVAGDLGVSSSGLRRLALIYERVHGDLPRDPRLGRMWPTEAIERLALAREEVQAGRAVSIEAALAALRVLPGQPSAPVQRPQAQAVPREPLEAMVEEMKLLRGAVEGMSRRLAAQERENRELRETISRERELPPGERSGAMAHADQAEPEQGPWDRVRDWLRRRGV